MKLESHQDPELDGTRSSDRSIGKATKTTIIPPLKQRHKLARLDWAKLCVKTNFENVLFTDESRATLDGPDGWMVQRHRARSVGNKAVEV